MNLFDDRSQLFWNNEILPRLMICKENSTLQQVADTADCHVQTLYKYLTKERGSEVSFVRLKSIALALGFSEADIIKHCFDNMTKVASLLKKHPDLLEMLYEASKDENNKQYIESFLEFAAKCSFKF